MHVLDTLKGTNMCSEGQKRAKREEGLGLRLWFGLSVLIQQVGILRRYKDLKV